MIQPARFGGSPVYEALTNTWWNKATGSNTTHTYTSMAIGSAAGDR